MRPVSKLRQKKCIVKDCEIEIVNVTRKLQELHNWRDSEGENFIEIAKSRSMNSK